MRTEVTKKLFTVDEYYRMAEAGIFTEDDRVELINGEIIEMSPIGNPHVACVDRANALFAAALAGRAMVSIQNPVRLGTYNEPQPDVVLMKPRADFYASKRHTPEDTLLIIEVADTTLSYDRNVKLPIYAASGVQEVWIEDLQHDVILVYRDPAGGAYKTCLRLRRGDSLPVSAIPDVIFQVEDFLGQS
jgi:Uma2 family endonuclease